MENRNDRSKLMERRRALQVIGAGIGAASGLVVLGGCNKAKEGGGTPGETAAPAKSGSCGDRGEADEAARNMRRTLQYKEKSDAPEKKCSLCAQFEAGKYGDCGGCKLFGGGVSPEGSCLSFAPKQAPGAAPAAPAAPAPT